MRSAGSCNASHQETTREVVTVSDSIGRLLAVGNVAEIFECGSRVLKVYKSARAKWTAFSEAAIHAAAEAL